MKIVKNLISKMKFLIVNRPAFYLSGRKYAEYILFIGRVHSLLNKKHISSYSIFPSKNIPNFDLHSVKFGKTTIYFQSAYRISRFLKGFENAGKRMWNRYEIDKLIGAEVPSAILDIGANIGEFAFYSNKRFKEQIKIIAVEPDCIALECLEKNLMETSILIEPVAASNKKVTQEFFIKTATADSSLHNPHGDSIRTVVGLQRIDKIIKNHRLKGPILIKMDTEGHEPEALLGLSEALNEVKWISIDTGPERSGARTTEQVVKILSNFGFTQIQVSKQDIVTASRF